MKRLIIALLCLAAVNAAVVSCEGYDDYVKNLKSKSLTKDEAKAEWESFLSDINDEESAGKMAGTILCRDWSIILQDSSN